METKQTAVDWLFTKQDLEDFDTLMLYKIAKQMEKEQIEEAYDNGGDHYTETGKAIWGKDYYNETYGQ